MHVSHFIEPADITLRSDFPKQQFLMNLIRKISLRKSHEEILIEKMETVVYLCSSLALYYKVMKSDIDKT